ncbi:ankyrin repeat domain-containing protein [Erysipelothrix inopinata]|uniref:Ankyrin repeat domain-containing protein n=1 Tax=Erysipelothrix inopinata TaxID=225084 RepID=A0A7G9S100_9FIRM|nr:ankyrin repeat domain-containing protein [Erysipelothrix inopinata]QNN61525.1 ankyrin repeat domain-containing protein [Erysipelothrix inopinata]
MRKIIFIILILTIVGCAQNTSENVNRTDNNKKESEQDTMSKIKINPNIDKVNENNESELLIAVHNNDIEAAINLIDQGANVNLQDNISDSPYLYAGAQGRTEILEHMLKYADIDFSVVNRYGGNTLIPAAEKGHIDNVKLLVADDRIDIDFQNNFGYTALIEAVALTDGSEKFVEIVKILVDAGADITLKDKSGKTALDYAKEKKYEKMIEILSKTS